jgi:hypothetical protein
MPAYLYADGSVSESFFSPLPFSLRSLEVKRGVLIGLIALALVAFVGVLSDGDGNSPRQPGSDSSSDETESVAQGLAAIDEGDYVAPDNGVVIGYQRHLDHLRSTVCPIEEEQVADLAVSSRDVAANNGRFVTTLVVLEEASTAARLAPDHEAMAISLNLPTQTTARDRCALYLSVAALRQDL